MKKSDGTYDVCTCRQRIKRFDTLKVGDKITAKYYETIVLPREGAGREGRPTADQTGRRARRGRPAGTLAHQQTITATITAIDPKTPSITFTGPRGWKYSSRVEDKKRSRR